MIPHARAELTALAEASSVISLDSVQGWNVQRWDLTEEDVDLTVDAYRAILDGSLEDDLQQLLAELEVDELGPPADSEQHARVMRADAIELVAAATVLAVEAASLDDLDMPNVPKMAGKKSDSGIDVVGVELTPGVTGPIVDGERLLLISVKHTVDQYASSMRGKLEKSVSDDFTVPYLHRQLLTLHGRMIQRGIVREMADRVMYFLRDTLTHPHVRIICVAAAAPPPSCNLPDQPSQLAAVGMPDAHFRMLLVPNLESLHERLVPSG